MSEALEALLGCAFAYLVHSESLVNAMPPQEVNCAQAAGFGGVFRPVTARV